MLLALLVVAVLVFYFLLVERIPARDLTMTRMSLIETRARAYWAAQGQAPAQLSVLPLFSGRDNETADGWGQAIVYAVQPPSFVTLRSLGSDGQPGGVDDAADIVYRFNLAKSP